MTRLGFHCHDIEDFNKVITSNGLGRGEFYNFSQDKLPELKKKVAERGVRRPGKMLQLSESGARLTAYPRGQLAEGLPSRHGIDAAPGAFTGP